MRISRPPRPVGEPQAPVVVALRRERVADRYVVEKELASGGMGIVYAVHDRTTGEARALKRLSDSASKERVLVEAFEREYQVLAGLDHPRIIRVYDYGVDEVGPYYTMELLEGQDMRKAAPLPPREACIYLRDVATSLALLHARRLIHRDLSPTNVRMTPDGHVKLLDFGALTAFGSTRFIVGTAPAVPPEAFDNAPLDQRADLYSLGALAYWMLTRRHAYPAKRIEDLPEFWKTPPPPLNELVEEIPEELSDLVLSLLAADPLARPASAAEVIGRLNVVAQLPPENEADTARLAQSFLLSPRFTGRTEELASLSVRVDSALRGMGSAVRIEAVAGMGRSRLLEELAVRAQIAGATVLRVDASMQRRVHGTTRALAARLLDALPDLARERGKKYGPALAALGRDVDARLSSPPSGPPPASGLARSQAPRLSVPSTPPAVAGGAPATEALALEDWFVEVSETKPLVLLVDNVEYADPASLGLLAALAKLAPEKALLLVVAERTRRDQTPPIGLVTLQGACATVRLSGLQPEETLELVRSLFGDVPSSERFAEWLHGRTAGSPLHCIEISRQLVTKNVIRYFGGIWALPVDRPDAELPAALEDALGIRVLSLSPEARSLAECLSLQREQPTYELCLRIAGDGDERRTLSLLDELARNDVLYGDQDGYRFSSTALREALLGKMDEARREENHRKLGEAFTALAGPEDFALQIEAGFHLIKGGEEVRGADKIAFVAKDSVVVRTLLADLHHAARPLEAALKVYKRHRRSVYARMPLLAALSHAGYYEERHWGEVYGDEALDALEDLSGLRLARRLRAFMGRFLGLVCGILFAAFRFHVSPKRDRNYPFREVLVQLFGAVTTQTGIASLSLDAERAARVAEVLEPFAVLPKRLTPVGIYEYCSSLQEIGRENQPAAYAAFEQIRKRLEDPRYYPTLPAEARRLYWTAAHFARGSMAVFRADSKSALESADALDTAGLKLYSMIASQLRFLYHMNRGEFRLAEKHHEQVELHAAHVGSAWQVETWEAPALIPINTVSEDLVGIARVADRLQILSRAVPSLKFYLRLARQSLDLVRNESNIEKALENELRRMPPKSFIGWAATYGFLARDRNRRGLHDEARAICEEALSHMTDADREYATLFLIVDLEAAKADAALGKTADALRRIDELLERFADVDHPIVHGSLHEVRARICLMSGDQAGYRASLAEVERRFRPTANPVLIAKYERLSEVVGIPGSLRRPGTGATHGAVRSDGKLVTKSEHHQDVQTVRVSTRKAEG
ncbi:MAG TPA: protein kinase [Polyangiaceae bacterium]|nr:protein kinase [Polyangiaceae bacterium]